MYVAINIVKIKRQMNKEHRLIKRYFFKLSRETRGE